MNRSFKTALAASMIFTALFTALFLFLAYHAIKTAYQNEIHTVQNIAGAVLTDSPEDEQAFIRAAKGETDAVQEGIVVLSKYGYGADMQVWENGSYKKSIITIFSVSAFLWLLVSGAALMFLFYVKRRQDRQEKRIAQVLDSYFADDFRFLKDEKAQGEIDNPHFSGTLLRLGNNLARKSTQLSEEKDKTKSLISDISHQLKTPIAALSTCLSMYMEAETREEKNEFLSRSMLQVDKLKLLTGALVNISRLETGVISLSREPVSLSALLIRAINGIYDKAAKKAISIETSEFDDLSITVDVKWTAEAIMNVLDNAIKYSPVKSAVSIQVTPMFSFVRIEIADQGIGIDKEEQNKIFQRFYRGANPFVKNCEGSGIGLFLTRRILEEQGGTVSVKSNPDDGSTFTIQLPM